MNTLKNIARKAIAVGSGALMLGTTVGFAAALDLAEYPAPFVKNGQFDGLIVVGEKAATSDVIGSIDIATSLQTASTVPVEGGSSTVTVSGDAVKIGESGDILEIGERIGVVTETLTDGDLEMLKSGSVTTQKGTTDFTQTLELDAMNGGAAGHGAVILSENNDDESGMFLFFNDGDDIFSYQLEFTSGLESDVDANNDAEDLEDESIFMLGQYFSIVDTEVVKLADDYTIELIAGDRSDTLAQGETRTYTVDGKTYEVTVLVIGDQSGTTTVKFLVNGEVTDALGDGETDTLSDGLEIGVRDIIETSSYYEGAQQSIVEFYLGANKIEIVDTAYSTTNGGASVEINRENIEDLEADIIAVNATGGVRINQLEFTLAGDAVYKTDIYLGEGDGLRDALDEPEGMLAGGWDIVFEGVSEPATTDIEFRANGDDQYDLRFTNRRGDFYSVPYAFANGAGVDALFGDEDDSLIFTEADNATDSGTGDSASEFNIALDDYFIVTDTDGTGTDNLDDTYVLQFTDLDTDDSTIAFENVGSGQEITATYTPTGAPSTDPTSPNSGDLTIGGKDFDFWMYDSGAGAYVLAVDLDNSGDLGQSTIVSIVTKGGGILTPSNHTNAIGADGGWKAQLTTLDEDVDSDLQQAVNITFSESTDELDVSLPANGAGADASGSWYKQSIQGEDRDVATNAYGTWFDVTTETNEADSLTIRYPSEQVEGLVFVTGAEVSRSTVSSAGATRINPIAVGSAVLDSDVSYDQDNMIVVGGPCVNTMAAQLLQNPADCAEGFVEGKGMLKLFDTGANTALLVAGYGAGDTVATSRVLAEYGDYDLAGEEMVVVQTSGNMLDVMKA